MRLYLQNAPTWVHSLTNGILFAVFMTIFSGLQDGRWISSLVGGVASGVVFGLLMGPVSARLGRRAAGVTEPLSAGQAQAARRAASRGPIPHEPAVRRAAAQLAKHHRDEMLRFRGLGVVTYLGFAAGATFFAVTGSPWWRAAVIIFMAFLAQQTWWPRRLQRRIDLLTARESPEG